MFVANDFPYLFSEELIERFNLPQIWQERSAEGLGEYALPILWNWPFDFLYGLLGKLNFSFTIIQIILVFIPFVLIGYFSIKLLLNYYNIRGLTGFAVSLFYLLNTYVVLLLDGGQFSIALAYAVFPLCYYLVLKTLSKFDIRMIIYSGLSISALGFFDIRFVYLLLLLVLITIVFNKYKLANIVKTGVGVGLIFLGLNSFWLIAVVFANAPVLPDTYTRTSQAEGLSFATLGHAITFLSPHWHKNVFGTVTPLIPLFFLIPILSFLAPILQRKNKTIGFWLLIAVFSIFLIKGTNSPMPEAYSFIFERIPGLQLFRDPTKFYFLLSLSFTILIGFTVSSLTKRLKYAPILLIVYFVVLASPVWSGKMTGAFSFPVYQYEFERLSETFQVDQNFGRILWLPSRPPLGFASPTHPNLEAARLVQKRPFAIGVVGSYEVFNFLREAPFIDQLLNISGIRYIGYPYPDVRRQELSPEQQSYYHSFSDQLRNSSWAESLVSDAPTAVFKTKTNQDRFFVTQNSYYVIGSDRIYWDLANLENFDLSKSAFIFAEEHPGTLASFKSSNSKIILYDKEVLDLLLAYTDQEKFVFPASKLNFSPDETGWWKRETADLIWWKDFLQQKYNIYNLEFDYGGGWAISEGENTLVLESDKFAKEKTLFVRALESGRGGNIEIYQNKHLIGKINTKVDNPEKVEEKLAGDKQNLGQTFEYDKSRVRWFEIGNILYDSPVIIKTSGDINVINSLVALNKEELKSVPEHYHIDNVNFNFQDIPKVNYTKIAPTHYKVNVEGITHQTILAFSESFNLNWELNGQKPVKLYSLINGYTVDANGEYDLYFTPQKYILPGLFVSASSLIVIIVVLLSYGNLGTHRRKK